MLKSAAIYIALYLMLPWISIFHAIYEEIPVIGTSFFPFPRENPIAFQSDVYSSSSQKKKKTPIYQCTRMS